jgi:hypothetical protein
VNYLNVVFGTLALFIVFWSFNSALKRPDGSRPTVFMEILGSCFMGLVISLTGLFLLAMIYATILHIIARD